MRAKVILSAAILAGLVLGPAFYFYNRPAQPPPDSSAQQEQPGQTEISNQTLAVTHAPRTIYPVHRNESVPAPPISGADPASPDHQEYLVAQEARLSKLAASGDPAALPDILSQLNSREADIRKAAVDAAVQFNSTDAIPALQNAMNSTDDLQEKVDIQKAIDFLQLPPL